MCRVEVAGLVWRQSVTLRVVLVLGPAEATASSTVWATLVPAVSILLLLLRSIPMLTIIMPPRIAVTITTIASISSMSENPRPTAIFFFVVCRIFDSIRCFFVRPLIPAGGVSATIRGDIDLGQPPVFDSARRSYADRFPRVRCAALQKPQ